MNVERYEKCDVYEALATSYNENNYVSGITTSLRHGQEKNGTANKGGDAGSSGFSSVDSRACERKAKKLKFRWNVDEKKKEKKTRGVARVLSCCLPLLFLYFFSFFHGSIL